MLVAISSLLIAHMFTHNLVPQWEKEKRVTSYKGVWFEPTGIHFAPLILVQNLEDSTLQLLF